MKGGTKKTIEGRAGARRALVVGVVAVSWLAFGCGDDMTPVGDSAVPRPDAGPRPVVGLCATDEGASVDLLGQWALKGSLEIEIEERAGSLVNLCPNPQLQTADIFLKATLEDAPGGLAVTLQVCSFTLPTIAGAVGRCPRDAADNLEISVDLGDELAATLPSIVIPLTTTIAPTLRVGEAFEPPAADIVLGAALADLMDPLPLWLADREGCAGPDAVPADCVQGWDLLEDADGDGNTGVTLLAASGDEAMVLSGQVFAAFRIGTQIFGDVQNEHCIDGTLGAALEYSVVDSDVGLSGLPLATSAVIGNLPPLRILDTSRLKMLRADGEGLNDFDDDDDGDVTCDEIVFHQSTFRR